MPRYGFNFQWMFSTFRGSTPQEADEHALDFMAKHGFNFVRICTDYQFWTQDYNYFEPDETVFLYLDRYLDACRSRGFQMNLNLHRAPGYCINRNDLEKHNLWKDPIAQDAFVFLWETFARRYKGVPNDAISFDLLNEPPAEGQYGMTRDIHAAIMRRTVAAIRAIDPDREIVIDGIGGGHYAMPELADLGVIHSGRGYQPMPVSHAGARWWSDWEKAPPPVYPGVEWDGQRWDKDALRALFAPWRAVEAQGNRVHIGEFGCYVNTPNDVALRWLGDLFSLWKEYGWGYSMWNFDGDFGIIGHTRPGAVFEAMDGYRVDRQLFDLMLDSRMS